MHHMYPHNPKKVRMNDYFSKRLRCTQPWLWQIQSSFQAASELPPGELSEMRNGQSHKMMFDAHNVYQTWVEREGDRDVQ